MEAVKKALDRISVEQIKLELLGTAYNNSATFLGRLDPGHCCYGICFLPSCPGLCITGQSY